VRDAWSYRLPTGVRAVFEDVIVDEESRGLGAGAALVQDLMDQRSRRARGVSYTSDPKRLAANRLWVQMGCVLRQADCYYFEFRWRCVRLRFATPKLSRDSRLHSRCLAVVSRVPRVYFAERVHQFIHCERLFVVQHSHEAPQVFFKVLHPLSKLREAVVIGGLLE